MEKDIGETKSKWECEDPHTSMGVEGLRDAIMANLYYRRCRVPAIATINDWYMALADTVRDRIVSRWIALCNPGLTELITSKIGDGWVRCLEEELKGLERYVEDTDFQRKWREVKRKNKESLAERIHERTGIQVDPETMFDIQVKRLHEYKRQHLNILHVITLFNRIRNNPGLDIVPRTFIFGGKAAPGYSMAKLIIKLITSVGEVINEDPDVGGRLKVVFFPDFNVKNAQPIYPAADLSEQISTAGKEASGTGNMKFSMGGALTIGTLDGANVEIREEVGAESSFSA